MTYEEDKSTRRSIAVVGVEQGVSGDWTGVWCGVNTVDV